MSTVQPSMTQFDNGQSSMTQSDNGHSDMTQFNNGYTNMTQFNNGHSNMTKFDSGHSSMTVQECLIKHDILIALQQNLKTPEKVFALIKFFWFF